MRTRGFTLIETVVYIALLAILMGGVLAATYQLLAGQGRASAHDSTEQEGGFVLAKFAFAMGQIKATSTPSIGTPNTHNFDITTTNGRFEMCFANQTIWIREGGTGGACGDTSYASSTSSNVKVAGLDFTYLPAAGAGPDGIVASTTINGETFRMTRYLRK